MPEQETLLKSQDDLQSLPVSMLERVAPLPTWHSAIAALNSVLETRLKPDKRHSPNVFLIGVPHSGNKEILTSWAKERKFRSIVPPTAEEILSQDARLFAQLSDGDEPWVLPELERWYLRNASGLKLVRQLFDQLGKGRLGRGIVGCDSWAWAYLENVTGGRTTTSLIAQAFDADRLTCWFQKLATTASQRSEFLFRQSDSGKYILPPPRELAKGHDSPVEITNFMQCLAAHSLGAPGVAWAVWRRSLLSELENMSGEEGSDRGEFGLQCNTLWLSPWKEIKQPSPPSEATRECAVMLHSLLLHNGLRDDLLSQLLPSSPHEVAQRLIQLQENELIEKDAEIWRVSALGYPVVRRFLRDEGYLSD